MNKSAISWTEFTWNLWTGCSKVSAGCTKCYAERLSLQNGWSKKPWTAANAHENIIYHPDREDKPRQWKQPSMVFVNSMSDAFHERVPERWIERLFEIIKRYPQHTFQILTKRPERAAEWRDWPANVWMGTSIEDAKNTWRLDALRSCGAAVKFISFEPLLGSVGQVNLAGFQWAIVGGESGPDFRPMDHAWARSIRNQCADQGVAFFFKQSSGKNPGAQPYLEEEDSSVTEWKQYPGEAARKPEPKAVQQSLF